MPRHYDDSDEDLYENPYAESNPRRRASYGDEYQYFIVDASGEPESGWEYREDAKDALRDGSSGRPGLKVVSRRSVDKGKLAAFFERNRDNPDYAEADTDADDEDVDVVENPASVVRTARDERLWRMAKASAARQGRARDWAYVMGIFQRMKHHTGGAAMNPADDEVVIGYSAQPSGGGWMPVVTANGRVVRQEWSAKGYDKDVAVEIAHEVAQELASRYRGDWRISIVAENPDDDGEDAPPPSFQLRASPTQQGLFAPSSYEAKPQKKKPAAPVDTRQRDLFGLPIESDDEPRENPRERTIREIKESRQYKAGAAAYRQLDRSAKSELGDQLVLGEFDWMDWFSDKPHPDFLRGFKNAWSPEDE